MSTSPPFLHVLDTDGKRVYARIGRGDGPHEIRFPWNIAQGRLPGEFLILDVGRRQLVPVAANGDVGDPTVMRFSNVPILADILENTYGVPRAVYPATDGIIMGDVVEVVSSSRGLRSLVLTHHTSGGVVDTLRNFAADSAYAMLPDDPRAVFMSVPLWAPCNDSVSLRSPRLRAGLARCRRARRAPAASDAAPISTTDRARRLLPRHPPRLDGHCACGEGGVSEPMISRCPRAPGRSEASPFTEPIRATNTKPTSYSDPTLTPL